jgi:hypothetical protein
MILDPLGPLTIYVSGDPGSAELLHLCSQKGVRYRKRDLRVYGSDIGHLIRWGLDSVPQVFYEDGSHVGGFKETADQLNKLPDVKQPKHTA